VPLSCQKHADQPGADPETQTAHSKNGSESPRVRIRLGKVESKFAAECGEVLGPLGVLFRCDERVVEIQEEEFSGELDRFKLARGGPKFNTLTPTRMRTWIEQFIETGVDAELKDKPGESVFMAKTMIEACARSLLVSPQFLKHIPRIYRILDVPIPIRKPNVEIVFPKLGFNPSLGVYCAPGAPEIKTMPLGQAMEIIEQALAGFCWENPQSKVHAIAQNDYALRPWHHGVFRTYAALVFCWQPSEVRERLPQRNCPDNPPRPRFRGFAYHR
jgi:hypothetical protein